MGYPERLLTEAVEEMMKYIDTYVIAYSGQRGIYDDVSNQRRSIHIHIARTGRALGIDISNHRPYPEIFNELLAYPPSEKELRKEDKKWQRRNRHNPEYREIVSYGIIRIRFLCQRILSELRSSRVASSSPKTWLWHRKARPSTPPRHLPRRGEEQQQC